MLREAAMQPVSMVLHVGDLAYADGRYKVWDAFMAEIEPLASSVPYMVGIGNHEAGPCQSGASSDPSGEGPYHPDWGNYGSESGGECGAMAALRFRMPGMDLQGSAGALLAAASAAAAVNGSAVAAAAASGAVSNANTAEASSRRRLLAQALGRAAGPGVAPMKALAQAGEEHAAGGRKEGESLRQGERADANTERDDGTDDVTGVDDASERSDGADKDKDSGDDTTVSSSGPVVEQDAGAGAGADSGVGRRHPGSATAPNAPFWFSFEYGTVHFTMLSSEHDLTEGSTQRRWLEADLAGVDRCQTPWLVVGLHRPMYVVYPHKDNRVVGDHLRDAIEDLLLQYDTDLVISGHVHTYYRSCRAAGGKCVDNGDRRGVTHLVIGTAGHVLSGADNDQKDWVEQQLDVFGFGRFDVDGNRMRLSFVRSQDGKVADSVTLKANVPAGVACDRSA